MRTAILLLASLLFSLLSLNPISAQTLLASSTALGSTPDNDGTAPSRPRMSRWRK